MASRAVPLALAGALAGGILLFGVSYTVRHHVTDDRFYLDALERADVYERVYQEVAADPEVARLIDPYFGDARWARALTVSALRLAFPPRTLRQGAEALVPGWTAYLRGERDTWRPRLDGTDSELLSGVVAHVAARLASATGVEGANTAAFRRQLEGVLADLLAGRVPAVTPSLPPLPEAEALRIATMILARAPVAPPPGARERVATALEAGDTHEALAFAAPLYLDPALRQVLETWRRWLEAGSVGDAVRSWGTADATGVFAMATASARSAVRWLSAPTALAAGILALGALAGLLVVLPRQGRSPMRWLGNTLVIAGLLGGAALVLGTLHVESTIAERITGLPRRLPHSMAALLGDVARQMGAGLWRPTMPVATGLVLGGAPLLVGRRVAAVAPPRRSSADRKRRGFRVVAGGMATATAVLLAIEIHGTRARQVPMRCNGHAELCDRPFDEVVFAATHNSMSAASLGWVFPNQDHGILSQLEAGYRALLIDVHYWGRAESIQRHLISFPSEYRAAVLGALARAAPPRPGVFLCHGLCGLGATPLSTALEVIADFLRSNPHEVLVLSIEDYVTPEDVADAFRSSGLLEFVHGRDEREPAGERDERATLEEWPTLREMIESGQRVVVLADHHGGSPSWYLPFALYMHDTSAAVRSPDGFTCGHNRGDPDAPFLLLNHWISTLPPDRVSAYRVNGRASLMAHVERCREERGLDPNLIAVDFASIGDALRVVDALNVGPR